MCVGDLGSDRSAVVDLRQRLFSCEFDRTSESTCALCIAGGEADVMKIGVGGKGYGANIVRLAATRESVPRVHPDVCEFLQGHRK